MEQTVPHRVQQFSIEKLLQKLYEILLPKKLYLTTKLKPLENHQVFNQLAVVLQNAEVLAKSLITHMFAEIHVFIHRVLQTSITNKIDFHIPFKGINHFYYFKFLIPTNNQETRSTLKKCQGFSLLYSSLRYLQSEKATTIAPKLLHGETSQTKPKDITHIVRVSSYWFRLRLMKKELHCDHIMGFSKPKWMFCFNFLRNGRAKIALSNTDLGQI